jgi:hypothetical protein
MTISITFSEQQPTEDYAIEPEISYADIMSRVPLKAKFVGFHKLGAKWQRVAAGAGSASVGLHGHSYKLMTVDSEGDFTLEPQ